MPELEIDGERFTLDQTDTSRLLEDDRLGGTDLRLELYEALVKSGPAVVVVSSDPDVRQRLFDAVAALAASGDAVWPSVLQKILDALRASGTRAGDH